MVIKLFQTIEKSIKVTESPGTLSVHIFKNISLFLQFDGSKRGNHFAIGVLAVRSAKFIARKNWIVTAADDSFIRVYNYDTTEKIIEFEAHKDYIRSLAVHPTLPYLLSASDDKTIKLWDWENGWTCTRIFEGHSHYVMQVALDPKDTHNFASASLDGTVMV